MARKKVRLRSRLEDNLTTQALKVELFPHALVGCVLRSGLGANRTPASNAQTPDPQAGTHESAKSFEVFGRRYQHFTDARELLRLVVSPPEGRLRDDRPIGSSHPPTALSIHPCPVPRRIA
jgi:hypothetical protein